MVNKSLQKQIGFVFTAFSALILVINIVIFAMQPQRSYFEATFLNIAVISACLMISISSIFIDHNMFKIFHCSILFYAGTISALTSFTENTAVIFYIVFFIVSWAYGFFNKNKMLKISVMCASIFCCYLYSAKSNTVEFPKIIKLVLLVFSTCLILKTIYDFKIKHVIDLYKKDTEIIKQIEKTYYKSYEDFKIEIQKHSIDQSILIKDLFDNFNKSVEINTRLEKEIELIKADNCDNK